MRIEKVYSYQHGSSPDFRVTNQNRWYVIREDREDGRILNQTIVAVVDSEDEAKAERQRLMDAAAAASAAAAALGRMGGSVRSDRKAASSAANGRLGGRGRKREARR